MPQIPGSAVGVAGGVIVELEDAEGRAGPRNGAVAGRDSGR